MKKIIFILTICLISAGANAQNTYYWFGGAGDWTDINHWSRTSGNSGNSIATQVPTASDNVVFDDMSGFGTTLSNRRVTFNLTASCKDFSVLTTTAGNAPRFMGSATLNVHGSFLLSANTLWEKKNQTNLLATGAASISPNGVTTSSSSWTIGSGTYQLTQNWDTGQITVNEGSTLTTNDHTINTSNFVHKGHLNLGSSLINCTGLWVSTGTPTVNAGTSHITVAGGDNYWNGWKGFVSVPGLTWYDITLKTAPKASLDAGCMFNNVVFEQTGAHHIRGNNTFQNLTLASGSSFEFNGGNTQTIRGILTASTPDCTGLMEILRFTTGGAVATLKTPAGSVTNMVNARITGMTGSGGTFNVIGVDNGGNNAAFTFNSPSPKSLYWVGGSDGNWNNTANWSDNSGGTGGYCIPTQFDDVIFDDNSITLIPVTIPANAQGHCHNITVKGWKNGPLVLTGGSLAKLNIYGANTWKKGMTYAVPVTVYQSTAAGEPLTFDGVEHRSNTYFTGTGSWVFQDDFNTGTGSTDYRLWLERGTLNTNNKKVYLGGAFYSSENSPNNLRHLILGSSELNVNRWEAGFNGGTTANYTLEEGTSHIVVRDGEISSSATSGFNPVDGQTYHNVTMLAESGTFKGNNITFNEVKVLGNSFFNIGPKTYNILSLAAGKIYTIQYTQTVKQKLVVASQPCGAATQLINSGSNGGFSMPAAADPVIANNVRMQGLGATGGNSFTANGVNLGGNTGWTFTNYSGKTLYWRGGSGSWNDPTHWTTNTDGSLAGTGCIPNQYDEVVFNEHSGPATGALVITVANSPAYFKNMTWTAAAPAGATITTANQHIYCYGTMAMGQNMLWTNASSTAPRIYFRSPDADQKITFNGASSQVSMEFDGLGAYQFQDYVKLIRSANAGMALRSGALDFNGKNAEMHGFTANDVANRNLNIVGSQILVETDWLFNGKLGTLKAAGSTISVGRTFGSGEGGFQWNNVIVRSGYPGSFNGGGSAFNFVNLKKNTTISGDNTFKMLLIDQNLLTIQLTVGSTQVVENMLYLSGTPCQQNTISSTTTAPAYLKVLSGNMTFDYVNVQNINASGLPLFFERNSKNLGGNANITFVPSATTGLVGLGPDWLCHEFNAADVSTYTLSAAGFFGSPTTTYKWTKVGQPGIVGSASTLDISALGFGTYKVDVDYGGDFGCRPSDEITVFKRTELPVANTAQSVCKDVNATVAKLTATGSDLRWYDVATGGTSLSLNTPLVDGMTYYVSQTISGCESKRIGVLIKLIACSSSFANPALRNRVSQ